jgi:hypothetical protein
MSSLREDQIENFIEAINTYNELAFMSENTIKNIVKHEDNKYVISIYDNTTYENKIEDDIIVYSAREAIVIASKE